MKSAPAVAFDHHASRSLTLATSIVALLAVAAVWLSGLPWWAQLALTVGIAVATGVAFGNLLRPRVRGVRWRSDGGADIFLGDDRREAQGEVSAARVMGPLVALSLRWAPRGRATLWLLPDNLDPETRRRLRMRLGSVAARPLSGNTDNA
jgi:toxin CptA